MIGNPEWFKRRKYGGWGLFPATWQGWVYLLVFAVLAFGSQFIPLASEQSRLVFLGAIMVILVIDTIDIMIHMKKDEREIMHEAIAERNALWVIIFALAAGVAYQGAQSYTSQTLAVDPVIIIAIFAGLIAKALTNIYLDRND